MELTLNGETVRLSERSQFQLPYMNRYSLKNGTAGSALIYYSLSIVRNPTAPPSYLIIFIVLSGWQWLVGRNCVQ